jgi:hypothetical protein
MFFPVNNYLLMNIFIRVILAAALVLFFVLFKKEMGETKSLLIILMCLGSIFFFGLATLIHSESLYLFISALALVLLQRMDKKSGRLGIYKAAITCLVLALCMTRMVGVALACAIIISDLIRALKNKGLQKDNMVVPMLIVIAIAALWEYRNVHLGTSYVSSALNEPAQSAIVSGSLQKIWPGRIIGRFFERLDALRVFGNLATSNLFTFTTESLKYAAEMSLSILFLVSLAVTVVRQPSPLNIYTALYVCSILVYMTSFKNRAGEVRFAIPILPLLFYYMILVCGDVLARIRKIFRPLYKLIVAIFSAGLCIYFVLGVIYMQVTIKQEHYSPFRDNLLKYNNNYDEQALALWIRDNSDKSAVYACAYPNILNVITERRGTRFPVNTDPKAVVKSLEDRNVKYVLMEKGWDERNCLRPALKAYPDRFKLIERRENSSLYEFR